MDHSHGYTGIGSQAVRDRSELPAERISTLTETVTRQLTELNAVLSEVHGRLESRYCNVFGPRPLPPIEPGGKLQSIPTHAAAEITEAAYRALNQAHGLNGLVSDLLTAL